MNSSLAVERKMRDMRITDEEFFLSGYYANYLANLLSIPCKRINRVIPRVTVIFDCDPATPTAWTDSKMITLNAASPLVWNRTKRDERSLILNGLLTHEFGHYRFTDFAAINTAQTMMSAGRWYPKLGAISTGLESNEEDYQAFLSLHPEKIDAAITVWHELQNIMEDGYIEECLYRVLSGLFTDGLSTWRYYQYASTPPFLARVQLCEENPKKVLPCINGLLLCYAKYGRINYDRSNPVEADSELLRIFREIMPIADSILYESSSTKRLRGINMMFLTLLSMLM